MSVVTYEQCHEEVDNFLNTYSGDVYVERGSANCSAFPCPDILESWSGETNAIYVYDVSSREEIFACAYWE
jgi:hypothetical protein